MKQARRVGNTVCQWVKLF